jgi:hypothetical protein
MHQQAKGHVYTTKTKQRDRTRPGQRAELVATRAGIECLDLLGVLLAHKVALELERGSELLAANRKVALDKLPLADALGIRDGALVRALDTVIDVAAHLRVHANISAHRHVRTRARNMDRYQHILILIISCLVLVLVLVRVVAVIIIRT